MNVTTCPRLQRPHGYRVGESTSPTASVGAIDPEATSSSRYPPSQAETPSTPEPATTATAATTSPRPDARPAAASSDARPPLPGRRVLGVRRPEGVIAAHVFRASQVNAGATLNPWADGSEDNVRSTR